jgi:molybdopterin-guanine dinucleotide biosynthesis protein A
MGRDKAHLLWNGESWSTRTARLLGRLFEEVLLVGGRPESHAPGRRIADPEGPGCALRGLVGALEAASCERVVVVATDLPFLSPDLLLALTAFPGQEPGEDAIVPCDADGEHPLCAIYRRETVLPVALGHLASDRLSLKALLDGVDTRRVSLAEFGLEDLGARALTNVNTPDEFARLEAS